MRFRGVSVFTIGSLFDGSGGFPLTASVVDGVPVWASEIEPYPIAVTRSRFPQMRHLGDISKINGGEIEPVDVVTFGSPCQDLSVAGKRAGLKHEDNGDEETTRSGLFMDAVRVIKQMWEATNGRYPTYAVWENVPGAFYSNGGEDFRTVLEELIKIVEPCAVMPAVPQKGWAYADCYVGDGWSLAYRVFDAQYWGKSIRDRDSGIVRHMGTPQRRRRIHLVLDLRGQRAYDVLFKREGLRGYFETGRTPWQGTAEDAERSVGTDDCDGTGCVAFHLLQDPIPNNAVFPCMGQGNSESGQASIGVCIQCYDARGNGDGAVAYAIGNGQVDQLKLSPLVGALNCMHDQQVVMYQKTCGALCARDYKGVGSQYVEEDKLVIDPYVRYIVRRLTPTECARLQGFPDRWGDIDHKDDFTDEEYAFWLDVRNTHAAINGKAAKEYTRDQMVKWYNKLRTDSAEYKMWGNGIALPPTLYVMQGIADAFAEERGTIDRDESKQ